MKKIKTKANQLHLSQLQEDDLIQIINMNDYFADGVPQPGKPKRVVDFVQECLQELIDESEDLTVDQAFNIFLSGSGDGGENFCVTTIYQGQIYTVIPTEKDVDWLELIVPPRTPIINVQWK